MNLCHIVTARCLKHPLRLIPCRKITTRAKETSDPFYITTPIFYPNAVPHIGHLYSLVIADIFARYARILTPRRPVYLLVGTDEHGLKIQKAAQAKGVDPFEFCAQQSDHFRALSEKANISHSRFIRTSEVEHTAAVQHVWRTLDAKDLIYKGSHEGWYSVSDECFYTDSQITRVEASPNSKDAVKELVVSRETGSEVEWMQEENYMFRLSAFREPLLEYFRTHESSIVPNSRREEVISILESSELEDLSISRPRSRVSWGVPVPDDPDHTIYVWIDALTAYLRGIGYPWDSEIPAHEGKSERAWPPDIQIIGKDILRFHAIYFPVILQELGLPMSKTLLAHAHWTVEHRKMSKSVGNVVDPFPLFEGRNDADLVRYYMARVGGRFSDDVVWSETQLKKHAMELESLTGNVFLRLTSDRIMARIQRIKKDKLIGLPDSSESRRELILSQLQSEDNSLHQHDVVQLMTGLGAKVEDHMSKHRIGEALEAILELLNTVNRYITATRPWAPSTADSVVETVYYTSLEALRIAGIHLQPYIPGYASLLLQFLDVPRRYRTLRFANLENGSIEAGTKAAVMAGSRLFNRQATISKDAASTTVERT